MRNFKKLLVWQKGMEVVRNIYSISNELPSEEKFGLISQMRRAAVSIPSNIAEGSCKRSQKQYHYYIQIATGSAFELETQLLICKEVGFLSEEQIEHCLNGIKEEQKMLTVFADRL